MRILYLGDDKLLCGRGGENGLGNRVRLPMFGRGGEAQDFGGWQRGTEMDLNHMGLFNGQRASLVKEHCIDRVQFLQGIALFDENAGA